MDIFNIVIPTFNEQNNVIRIIEEIKKQSKLHNVKIRVYLIDDCSDDELTINNIKKVVDNTEVFSYRTCEKNKGQHIATKLGLDSIREGFVGVLDCDMQDPVEDLFNMYNSLHNSDYEAIIGVRKHNGRKGTDSKFKILTASMYYKLISIILKKKVYDSSNFYIIKLSKDNIKKLDTDNLRQSVQDNFNYTTYYYTRQKEKKVKQNIIYSSLLK